VLLYHIVPARCDIFATCKRRTPTTIVELENWWVKALCAQRDNRTTKQRCIPLRHLRAALMNKHNVDVSAQTVPRDLEAVGAASSQAREAACAVAKQHPNAPCVGT
jgi:hypothetical protein